MKKTCAIVLCIMMVLVSIPTFAAPVGLKIDSIEVDYRNEQIVVNCTTDVGYRQSVIAVMYSGASEPADWNGYVHAGETVTDLDGKCTLSFSLDRRLTDTSYTVKVTGSGHKFDLLVDGGKKTFNMIPLNTEDDLMSGAADGTNYNDPGLTTSELEALFNTHADFIGLEGENLSSSDANDLKVLGTMISIRDKDFGGSFSDMTDVSESYEKATMLVDLGNTANATSWEATFTDEYKDGKSRAELLGIDLTSDTETAQDYRAAEDSVNALLSSMNTTSPATSVTEMQTRFERALATATVNRIDVDTVESKLSTYKDVIGIDASSFVNYSSLSPANKLTVARMMTNKNFADYSAVKTAFDNALALVLANLDGIPVVIPGGNGGGGGGGFGGGGGGGVSVGGSSNPVVQPTVSGSYTDMSDFAWAEESIVFLSYRNIINGYPDGSFGGNKSISRSEYVKIIVTALGLYNSDAKCDFSDTEDGAWYVPFIGSAVENELVNGYPNGNFGVSDVISREDAAVILNRALKAIGAELTKENPAVSFTDADSISDYSGDAVSLLQQYGIINGFSDNSFGPGQPMTRAQAAKIVFELLKRL